MAEIVLDQPRIGALVGQGEAARMTQHVRMSINGQACTLPIGADRQPGGLTAERAAPLEGHCDQTQEGDLRVAVQPSHLLCCQTIS